jgi:hypothetical protein
VKRAHRIEERRHGQETGKRKEDRAVEGSGYEEESSRRREKEGDQVRGPMDKKQQAEKKPERGKKPERLKDLDTKKNPVGGLLRKYR